MKRAAVFADAVETTTNTRRPAEEEKDFKTPITKEIIMQVVWNDVTVL